MFQLLFERSADAIWLFDPRDAVFVDCNDAAIALMRSGTKDRLLRTHPAIAECVVVGVGDVEWGQRVCFAGKLQPDEFRKKVSVRVR